MSTELTATLQAAATSPRRRRTLRPWTAAALLLAALCVGAEPLWMQSKALLAQALLQSAWAQSREHGAAVKPWPWADTHPVARLQVPRLGIDEIVLAGDSGRVLAFGPGWAESSAQPGSTGNSIISGHRDHHFRFLRELQDGDRITLETANGVFHYRVHAEQVVDSRSQQLRLGGAAQLSLVTCWPFDAITAGGPMRYVVTALPDAAAEQAVATTQSLPTETIAAL